jgi:mono/diheme cytochrome c family protein
MKLFKLALTGLLGLWFVAACNTADGPKPSNGNNTVATATTPATVATPDEWADVRRSYQNFCVNCHKADGTGGSVTFEDGGKPLDVPSLKSEKAAKEPDAEYIEQIKNGGDGMPAFKNRLKDDKIKQLVAFIRKEIQGQNVKLPPAAPAEEPAAKPDAPPAKPGASPAKSGTPPAKADVAPTTPAKK